MAETITTKRADVSLYRDFDAAVDEVEEITFKVAGRVYTLPGKVPARVVLKFFRRQSGKVSVSNMADMVEDWLKALVGSENFETMLDDGVDLDTLVELTVWLLDAYNIVKVDETGEEGDSPNVEEEGSTNETSSSDTGLTSKPISSAIT